MRKRLIISTSLSITVLLLQDYAACAGDKAGEAVTQGKEWEAIEYCLGIIRKCQLDDGMIRMTGTSDRVWTVPYFGNFAAMALLAAHEVRPNPQDLERVERWLNWYARNQEADGTIYDRGGTASDYKSNGKRDSTDSYAATFLMVVWRYKQACRKQVSTEIINAVKKAVIAIEAVMQADGLTIAKPDYKIKYLMDNIEVYQGLTESTLLFDSVGLKDEAQKVRKMAARNADGIAKFWSEQDGHYAYAIDMKGKLFIGLSKPYPHGLAQMFGLSYIRPCKSGLWKEVSEKFEPDDKGIHVERWLITAKGLSDILPEEKEKLRKATVETALAFSGKNIYIERPAMAVIALIDGKSRFPDVPSGR